MTSKEVIALGNDHPLKEAFFRYHAWSRVQLRAWRWPAHCVRGRPRITMRPPVRAVVPPRVRAARRVPSRLCGGSCPGLSFVLCSAYDEELFQALLAKFVTQVWQRQCRPCALPQGHGRAGRARSSVWLCVPAQNAWQRAPMRLGHTATACHILHALCAPAPGGRGPSMCQGRQNSIYQLFVL